MSLQSDGSNEVRPGCDCPRPKQPVGSELFGGATLIDTDMVPLVHACGDLGILPLSACAGFCGSGEAVLLFEPPDDANAFLDICYESCLGARRGG